MKQLNRLLPAFLVVASLATSAFAQDCVIPPNPRPIVDVQPDGTQIQLQMRGNAFGLWYSDDAGYPILQTEERWYVYARIDAQGMLQPTTLRVGVAAPGALSQLERNVAPTSVPSTGPNPGPGGPLKPSAHVGHGGGAINSVVGSVKNLVLLLRFSDHGPGGQNRTLPSTSDVDKIMNAVGGDPVLAPTGSVRDHYLEMSYNQLTIDSDVVGWLDVPNSETHYANGNSGLTSLTWDLIIDGLNLADASVDFSQYDVDNDGWVDAITFLHSGYGAEWGGTDSYGTHYSDRMWSHKWQIPTWTSNEGTRVAAYHISPGLWGTSGSGPGRIGVVSHETGHFFGMPDLYDTDGSSNGNGNWGLMAAGSWGFDGSQQNPSHISAWGKSKLGWLDPQVILPGAHVAPQIETNPSAFMIDSGYPPGEYLLIENREQVGFDAVIPREGLAIWHVDETKGALGSNNPNTDEGYPGQSGWPNNGSHFRLALLQPDDDWDLELDVNRGDSGDIYYGNGVNALDNNTSPSTQAYQGGNLIANGNRIQGIGNGAFNVPFTYVNNSAPSITSTSPTAPVENVPYSFQMTRSGGQGPFTWSECIANPSYSQTGLGSSLYSETGVAQGWQADDSTWQLNLPFPFPYYGDVYTTVYVSSNGFIDFSPAGAEAGNSSPHLRLLTRIAPLWDDLRTDGGGSQDIYIDSSATEIKIRWRGEHFGSGNAVRFSVTLFDDGRIRFDYGSGNTSISPSVGISRGQAGDVEYGAGLDGNGSIGAADSVLFTLQGSQMPPGLSIDGNGLISGTPTTVGTYMPSFRVTGSNWVYAKETVDLSVLSGFIDCNNNGTDDATDISNGTSQDCNGNGIPDECEPDCDNDGVPDDCEFDCDNDGTPDDCEPDCDSDGIPDDCEADCDDDGTPDDCEPDCDSDGTPDDCEADCDNDGTPDDCETDCDNDGTPDDCEPDCNNNGTPDDCEGLPDCNNNGNPDTCDIFFGFSPDVNGNGIPDECDPDCNNNGVPDDLDPDCDLDGIPDDCEADCDNDGTPDDCEADCDNDGTPDDCESVADCNSNGIPDACDPDCDFDGIPDDCEVDLNANGTPDDCEQLGVNYCTATVNSSGGPAAVHAFGSSLIAMNDLNLGVTSMPANRFGYFLMSSTQGFIPLFGGSQGNFCLGAPFVRFSANGGLSTAQGTFDFSPDLTNLPQNTVFVSGQSWNFQCWFRDVNPTSTSNTTDGISITFF